MSGLFDRIADRFSVTARPAILPRARSRFEGVPGDEDLHEETAERRTEARASPAPSARRSQSETTDPVRNAAQTPPQPPLDPGTPTRTRDADPERPPGAPDRGEATRARPPEPAPPSERPEAGRAMPPPEPAVPARNSQRGRAAPRDDAAPRAERVTLRETERHVIETRTTPVPVTPPPAPPVIEARRAAEDPDDRPDAVSAPQRSAVSVRIGRVEVTAPPPERPAPPAPAPAAPARASVPRTAPRSSGLTDYLGWKKR